MSFELGKSPCEIGEMPEADLALYAAYAEKYMLPRRRLEFYLAQIAYVAASAAGSQANLTDFLLDSPAAGDEEDESFADNPLFADFNAM